MVLKNIYIARHGYRMNWLPPPHPPNPTGIDSDPPLAPHGVEQAKELAKYIGSLENDKPQFILSSPFYRCVETAEPISEELNIPIVLERGVGEWYKVGRGIVPEPANYDRLNKFFNHLASAEVWDRDNTVGVIPSLQGESEEDIMKRCQKFWQLFIPKFEAMYPDIENVLIVSHAATKIALGMSLLGFDNVLQSIDDKGTILRAGACSLDKYTRTPEDKWQIIMNGNCEFLSQGEEMNWNFHFQFEAGSDEDIKARKLEAEQKFEELEVFKQEMAQKAKEQELNNSGDETEVSK